MKGNKLSIRLCAKFLPKERKTVFEQFHKKNKFHTRSVVASQLSHFLSNFNFRVLLICSSLLARPSNIFFFLRLTFSSSSFDLCCCCTLDIRRVFFWHHIFARSPCFFISAKNFFSHLTLACCSQPRAYFVRCPF